MKPKGLQDRTLDPYHGIKLLGAWAGVVVAGYGFVALAGFLAYAIGTYLWGMVR